MSPPAVQHDLFPTAGRARALGRSRAGFSSDFDGVRTFDGDGVQRRFNGGSTALLSLRRCHDESYKLQKGYLMKVLAATCVFAHVSRTTAERATGLGGMSSSGDSASIMTRESA